MVVLVEADDGELLAVSVPEAARRCGLGKSLFWELIRQGNGPPIIKIGRRTLVPLDGLRAWLQAKRVGGGHVR
jgi:predicted DNA-binding transcriptional regulator AlpA